jgi:hypothetical protein
MLHGITGIAQPLGDMACGIGIIFHQQDLQVALPPDCGQNSRERS